MTDDINCKVVKCFLDCRALRYVMDGNSFVTTINISKDHGIRFARAELIPGEESLTVRVVSPIGIPEDHRENVCRYLCEVNHQLRACAFDIDMTNGEVAARVFHYCGESELTDDEVFWSLSEAVEAMLKYGDGLVEAAYRSVPGDAAKAMDAEKASGKDVNRQLNRLLEAIRPRLSEILANLSLVDPAKGPDAAAADRDGEGPLDD